MLELRDIEGAEKLAGVSYTPAEREQMLNNLEGQIASAVSRRAVKLENSTPMASLFDPRLPGFQMPAAKGGVQPRRLDPRPLPGSDEDIAFASINQLSHWLARGEITSRRLTDIYLARIAALNPKLECFALVTPEQARA